ncbi:MAG: HIT family protein [bacterium]|nr:HIT family protein [bacterium]
MFELHPRLAQDTEFIAALPLSHLLLMRDARYPWLILVPARQGLKEVHDLAEEERARLIEEIADVSKLLERLFAPDKINIGALGNLVPQLHIHVIARRAGDAAWPGPVWGQGEPVPYVPEELEKIREALRKNL